MKLHVFDIPNEPAELAAWLDEQLAGPHLPAVVAELLAVQNRPLTATKPGDIRQKLGANLTPCLAHGTAALTVEQRRELLQEPRWLLALQEEIDLAGGGYWNDIALRSPETAAWVARGQERLTAAWQRAPSASSPTSANVDHRSSPGAGRWLAFLALAATIVVAFFVWRPPNKEQPQVAWGWNEPELFAGKLTATEYLNRLADAGEKWRKQRPETKAAVGKRIREMIAGCQRLIDQRHPSLSAEDEAALKKLCAKWLGQFQEQWAALEQGTKTPLEARAAMDEIVEKLTKRLRSGMLA